MDTVLVPIIKYQKGDLQDINNYRPIALNNVASKVFENIVFERYCDEFKTTDN